MSKTLAWAFGLVVLLTFVGAAGVWFYADALMAGVLDAATHAAPTSTN